MRKVTSDTSPKGTPAIKPQITRHGKEKNSPPPSFHQMPRIF